MTAASRELPAGWEWVKLGDVVESINNGCTATQNREGQGHKVSRIETISSGKVNMDKTAWVELDQDQVAKYMLLTGDILFSHINSSERVGNCALYEAELGNLIHGLNLLKIRPCHLKAHSKFLISYLRSDKAKHYYLSFLQRAVNQASINIRTMKIMPIPLPPLSEQKRIAGILSKADEAKRLRDEATKKADEIISAIFHEMHGSRVKKDQPLPDGWKWVKLGDVAETIRGVTFKGSDAISVKVEGTIPILRAGNISDGLLLNTGLIWVRRDLVRDKQLLKKGDIAICMSSGSPKIVGKTATLKTDWTGSVGAFCAIIRPSDSSVGDFLSLWFKSDMYFEWRNLQAVGSNIQNLRMNQLLDLSLPLPPLSERERIVSKLNKAERIKEASKQNATQLQELQSSLLHHAFRGEV